MFQTLKNKATFLKNQVIFMCCLMLATPSFAGTGSTDKTFEPMFLWIKGVLEGSGGTMLAILSLVVAIGAAIMAAYKTMMAFAVVLLLCLVGPTVIEGAFSAVF